MKGKLEGPWVRICQAREQHLPVWGAAGSAAGDVPKSRAMMPRLGGGAAGAVLGAGACGASGAGTGDRDGAGSAEAGPPVAAGGSGGCGVPGLELPVEAELGGTMGDCEPEEGLCPLAAGGDVCPWLRASIISRKLRGR